MALASYSTVQAKRFPGFVGCQDRPAIFQPPGRHLYIVEVFYAGFDKFACQLDVRLPPAFRQLGQTALDIGIERNGKHNDPICYVSVIARRWPLCNRKIGRVPGGPRATRFARHPATAGGSPPSPEGGRDGQGAYRELQRQSGDDFEA